MKKTETHEFHGVAVDATATHHFDSVVCRAMVSQLVVKQRHFVVPQNWFRAPQRVVVDACRGRADCHSGGVNDRPLCGANVAFQAQKRPCVRRGQRPVPLAVDNLKHGCVHGLVGWRATNPGRAAQRHTDLHTRLLSSFRGSFLPVRVDGDLWCGVWRVGMCKRAATRKDEAGAGLLVQHHQRVGVKNHFRQRRAQSGFHSG